MSQPLVKALAARKDALVGEWLSRTLEAYPDHTAGLLARDRDPFRNPVGHAFKEAFPALVDELLGEMDAVRITSLLDGIVRIRAVQDFTASRAVAFVFLLKQVIREELNRPTRPSLSPHPPLSPSGGEDKGEGAERAEALADLERRIDEMALLAFDLFMKCREELCAIKLNEARSRTYLLERMQGRTSP